MNPDALFQAITQTPGDDALRLVYADWLEEHGNEADLERAEFIRLQIRRTSLDRGDPDRLLLGAREKALLEKHREAWVAGFASWARNWVQFRRGMPFHIQTTAGQFLRRGKVLRRGHPVESVDLTNAADLIPKLAASGLLAGLRSLVLRPGQYFAEGDFTALVECKDLRELVCLDQSHGRIPIEQLRSLLTSDNLPNLRELRVPVGGKGAIGAVAARQRSGIQTLNVQSCSPALSEVAALAASPGMMDLHTLDISRCKLKDSGVAALARGESLRQLRRLNLDQNELQVEAIRALAESPVLQHLTHLSLEFCDFQKEGAAFLAGSPNFSQLRELTLDSTNLKSAGVIHLARSPYLRALTRLSLRGAQIDRAAAEELASSPLLANVVDLRIDGHDDLMEPEAISLLLRSPAVSRVRYLKVGVNPMNSLIIDALAESPYLTRLEGLFLAQAKMTGRHVEVLARSPNLASLKILDLSWNHIDDAGARALAESPQLGSLLLDAYENPLEGSRGDWALQHRFGSNFRLRWLDPEE